MKTTRAKTSTAINTAAAAISVNPGGLGLRPLKFWSGWVVESSWNIIIFYNVREYEIRTLSKSGNFSDIERLAYVI